MSDELLPYYEKELAYIRQMGAAFSREHPKIAGRLGINSDTVEDPHVARLIESFAYLNARIQHKLDDDFPELSDALLSVIFPHYQRPIPSMAITQFTADQEQLSAAYIVPAGTLIQTEQFKGENCRFSTAYPVELLPITVSDAKLIGKPFNTPGSSKAKGCHSVLKLSLETFNDDIRFSEIQPERIRFYLSGQAQHIHPLYQMLLNDCHSIFITADESENSPVVLDSKTIQAVGFDNKEGLLPYHPSSFLGYRLLTEYFVFPQKFMFIDFVDLAKKIPEKAGQNLDIYIYLHTANIELEHNISAKTFILGCSPAVNLFKHKADPIKIDNNHHEYQLIPDARRPLGYEIHSVENVLVSSSTGDKQTLPPLYGLTHDRQGDSNRAFWFAARRSAKLNTQERDDGTDIFLSLVDLDLNPNTTSEGTLIASTLCSNRDLPGKLPYSLDQPKLQCVDGSPPCSKIRFLTQPTASVRPPLRNRARWRLLSHLSLNHLSLTGKDDAKEALKEILRLYDFKESSVSSAHIESILHVKAKSVSAPLTINGRATMCRGSEIEIVLDPQQFSGSSSYLFASILEHFFSLYCSINSFTRVLVKLKNKEGYLKKCPPRAGKKVFL